MSLQNAAIGLVDEEAVSSKISDPQASSLRNSHPVFKRRKSPVIELQIGSRSFRTFKVHICMDFPSLPSPLRFVIPPEATGIIGKPLMERSGSESVSSLQCRCFRVCTRFSNFAADHILVQATFTLPMQRSTLIMLGQNRYSGCLRTTLAKALGTDPNKFHYIVKVGLSFYSIVS